MFLETLRIGLELLNRNAKSMVIKLELVRFVIMLRQTYSAKCLPLDPIRQVTIVVIISSVLRFLWTRTRNVRLVESAMSPAKLPIPLDVLLLRAVVLLMS